MKYLILFLIFSSQLTQASFHLGDEFLNRTTKYPVIPKKLFKKTIKAMEQKFQFLAISKGERLITYAGWTDPTADHATARRWDDAQVLIFRGMAHRSEINQDALALIVCHEIGHLYGGEPLKRENDFIAAEGQADYFATKFCLREALSMISPNNIEQRLIQAINGVGEFLAHNWGHSMPSTDTPDLSEVENTYLEHPTPQCRFDTYMAGLNGQARPKCWYKESSPSF